MNISNQEDWVKCLKDAKEAKGELKVEKDGEETTFPAFRVGDSGLFVTAFFGTGTGGQFTDGVSVNVSKDHLGEEVGPSDGSIIYWKQGQSFSWYEGNLKVSRDDVGNLYFGSLSAKFTGAPVEELIGGIFSVGKV
ncbi:MULTISPECIES: hypothetical protein [Pseudomonas]|uniref:Uncharacterized protein n=1 Tax=Pseudomonas wuhanensis TaxID=2954098 RepID=A0ABY9GRQ7_9PSED|nr:MULTISPECIES: hypothetical protein [unclassified Pseudomonas]WLI12527.1 hypothetical protein PSH65_31305 [Pseudomonas sp. FP603]WLI18394.1 hypothetical protein PSH88_29930 [Pseudomonas sp. FP607]